MAAMIASTSAQCKALDLSGRQAFSGRQIQARAPQAPLLRRLASPTVARTTKGLKSKSAKGYDKSAPKVDPATPAFTRRREVFAGRLAMLGFSSALIGEIFSGKGPIGQLALETSLPTNVIEGGLVALIGYIVFQSLRPGSPTWSRENQQDIKKRPTGPIQDPKINAVRDTQKFLGTSKGFGFTKLNEVYVGRVAQLGFLAAVIGEKVTGKGPLGQFGLETGVPLNQAAFGLIIFIGFFLVAALFEGNYGPNNLDEDSTY